MDQFCLEFKKKSVQEGAPPCCGIVASLSCRCPEILAKKILAKNMWVGESIKEQ